MVLVLAACAPAPRVADPSIEVPFPSPLNGPGQPQIEGKQLKELRQAWKELLAGQFTMAEQRAMRTGSLAQALLLRHQATFVADEEGVAASQLLPQLNELTTTYPDYAALWATLSVIAEQAGDEATALHAALQGGQLWHRQPWGDRAEKLHQRWVVGRVEDAAQLVAEKQAATALELLDEALALEEGNRPALLLKAEALIELQQVEEAELLLASLPADADALFLAGRIAEDRQDWITAMDIYTALPDDYSGRASALQRAQLQWRLSHLPEYVQQARASEHLTRAELAVLLVALVPQVEGIPGRQVPVLSDIVDLPSNREILVAVGLQLIEIDPLEHRFYPDRDASPTLVRSAIDGLCHLVGFEPLPWCEEEVMIPSCTEITSPVTGKETAELLIQIVQGEGR